MSEPGAPDAEAAFRAGQAELAAGRREAAEAHFREALAARPGHPQALLGLAGLLQLEERAAEALALCDAVLGADPGHAEAWLGRGDSLFNLDRYDEATQAYRRALVRGDLAFEALLRLGLAFAGAGRFELALEAFGAAVQLRPDSAEARVRRGLLRLQLHQFAPGWEDYERRWSWDRFLAASRGLVPQALVPALARSPTAEDLAGKRVLVVGEQGIGDQVLFASIVPDLARAARSVTLVCEARLVALFRSSFQGVTVLPPTAQVDSDAVDVVLAMASLGAALRPGLAAFAGAPYLTPAGPAVRRWAERLGPRTKRLRVGLSWRGGVAATRRRSRSVPLAELGPILDAPDCEFVSLQYGDPSAEVAAVNAGRMDPIRLFPPKSLDDFEDLAGLIANLDVVVSVQTAVAHLCGAIGRPCFTLVAHNPEWAFNPMGPTTPWHACVRLFRQPAPGAWEPVIAEVAAALRAQEPAAG